MTRRARVRVGLLALAAAISTARAAHAQASPSPYVVACPEPPPEYSAASWDLPAGCPAPFDVRAHTILGDLRFRVRAIERQDDDDAPPAPTIGPKAQRLDSAGLPRWAWAALAGAGAIAGPATTCGAADECSHAAQIGSAAGVATLVAVLALVLGE